MSRLSVYMTSFVVFVTLQTVLSYPATSGLGSYGIADQPDLGAILYDMPQNPLLEKRRGMGWRMCSGFFKWRCGPRVVLSKKLGEFTLH